jgi:hypothetical protein
MMSDYVIFWNLIFTMFIAVSLMHNDTVAPEKNAVAYLKVYKDFHLKLG